VALAKTIISRANFLLLDEPTNHLDIHSVELMIEALNRYEGTYILVSHDRYFISKTANKIWEIVDHQIKEFAGGYEEYVEWKARMLKNQESGAGSLPSKAFSTAKTSLENVAKQSQKSVKKETEQGKKHEIKISNQTSDIGLQTSTPINRLQKKELQKQQKLFQQLEEKIALLTKQKAELESALGNLVTYSDKQKFLQTESAYNDITAQLDGLNMQYEQVFEQIINLEAKQG
jgi:ATP-binding cassette subfamily F protein 3